MESGYFINRVLLSLTIGFILLSGCDARNSGPSVSKTLIGNVAIKGYDTVAYFRLGKAMRGNSSISYKWHNAIWYFAKKENRDMFTADPEKYAPQYGGYCAWAMAGARKAHTDPEVWKIVDGKLYLNCSNAAFGKWSNDIPGNIKKADANWSKLSGTN
jgi:hypothetical protein